MYLEHFGLNQYPFSLTPNTHFYANLPRHKSCIDMALTVLAQGEGFLKISGEVGTGKTLLCRHLLSLLHPDQYYTIYIPNPFMTPQEFRYSFGHELGLDMSYEYSETGILEHIYNRLMELAQQNIKLVLVVDEAQAMSNETLEALRLLTNLETEERKLIQVVLFGQPELDERLSQHNLRQLLQRITFSEKLAPLDLEQVQQYIHFRMTQAGYNGDLVFRNDAVVQLFNGSAGIPRLINILCHKSLMLAYGKNMKYIDKNLVLKAITDTDSTNTLHVNKSRRWSKKVSNIW